MAGLAKLWPDFLGVEYVEKNDLVAVITQWLNGAHNGGGILVKIGEHDDDAAAMQKFLEVQQGLGEVSAGAGLGLLQAG